MQHSSPPIFRTDTQRRLLVELLTGDDELQTLSDLARTLDVDPTTVMREIDRLCEAGLIEEHRVGRARTVRIQESNPYVPPLRQLLDVSGQEWARSAERPLHHGSRHESSRHDRRPLPSSRQRS